jgi:CubicO group peptidase (beta-lactamase class C family)
MNALLPGLLKEQKAAGVGIAVIREGEVIWTGYYGEQAPGIPITEKTAFNTASVAKTLTAETLLALAAKGTIDLDESIAGYVAHADLQHDPRYALLTPRLLMSHRAGLRNWPYEYADGKLAFDSDPGTRFSYSGAGVELAAQYAEARTGEELQTLASEYVLAPLGIREMSMGHIPAWAEDRLAVPMDGKGVFRSVAELDASLAHDTANGAADDLIATVPAYATLISALIAHDWLPARERHARETILTSLEHDPIYACPREIAIQCPSAFGHSIGWQVYRYDAHTVLIHSGSDAGENALVYYSPDHKDGAVIFVNGANGWVIMTRVVEVIGDEPLIASYYRGLVEKVMHQTMPPLDRR